MVDFVEVMRASCQPAVVEYQMTQNKGSGYRRYWPQDVSESCHIAVLGFHSAKMTGEEEQRWLDDYSREVSGYYLKASKDVQIATLNAIKIILSSKRDVPIGMRRFMTRAGIDMRAEMKWRYPKLPSVANVLNDLDQRTQLYYLTFWGEPGAFNRLHESIAAVPGPRATWQFLQEIQTWNLPGYEKIIRSFFDDGRQDLFPGGTPMPPVGQLARKMLGHNEAYRGPTQPTDEQGRPILRSRSPMGSNLEPR